MGSWLGEGEGAVLGLFIGCFISMSSTAVVLKCLVDFGQEALPFGQVCLVILIVQDFVLGFMLAMLNTASGGGPTAKDVGATLGVLVAFLVGSYLVARLVLTRLMALLSRLGARGVGSEVFQLGALCLCLTGDCRHMRLC